MGLLIKSGEAVTTNERYVADIFCECETIQPSADADLVVFDPNYRGKISAKTHHINVDYSVFEGWKIEGRPSHVTVRGQVAVRDGKFLQRKPSHF